MMELLKIFGGFIGFMFVCVSVVVVVSWVMLMAVNDIDINTESTKWIMTLIQGIYYNGITYFISDIIIMVCDDLVYSRIL